jgi:hypothetical protein
LGLPANSAARVEVGLGQLVTPAARTEMPPKADKIVQYAWHLGSPYYEF